MKTKEELDQLKEEYEALNNKLKELSKDELKLVVGGFIKLQCNDPNKGKDYYNKCQSLEKDSCSDCNICKQHKIQK